MTYPAFYIDYSLLNPQQYFMPNCTEEYLKAIDSNKGLEEKNLELKKRIN